MKTDELARLINLARMGFATISRQIEPVEALACWQAIANAHIELVAQQKPKEQEKSNG